MSAHATTNGLTPVPPGDAAGLPAESGSETARSEPKSSPAPDAEWIRRILDEYGDQLLRYSARWLHGDTDRAADVVQDAFVQLCRPDTKKPEPQHLKAWLYAVCRNRALDIARKERRMTTFSPQHANEPDANPSDAAVASAMEQQHGKDEANEGGSSGLQGDHPDWSEQRHKVYQAMGVLSETQQDVLRLKFQSDLSYAEIARVLDLSVTNVGFLIHTAMKALRQHLVPEPAVSGPSVSPTHRSRENQSAGGD